MTRNPEGLAMKTMAMPQCTQLLVVWTTKHRAECLLINVPVDELHRHDQAPLIVIRQSGTVGTVVM